MAVTFKKKHRLFYSRLIAFQRLCSNDFGKRKQDSLNRAKRFSRPTLHFETFMDFTSEVFFYTNVNLQNFGVCFKVTYFFMQNDCFYCIGEIAKNENK